MDPDCSKMKISFERSQLTHSHIIGHTRTHTHTLLNTLQNNNNELNAHEICKSFQIRSQCGMEEEKTHAHQTCRRVDMLIMLSVHLLIIHQVSGAKKYREQSNQMR